MKKSKTSRKSNTRRKQKQSQKSLAQHYQKRKWAILGLLVCTFLVYLPSLQNDFVNWDDNTYVYENEVLINGDIGAMISEPMAHNYHPITMLSLAVNHAIGGMEPFGYHLTNLLLHLANTVLVFWLLYVLTKRTIFIAFIGALIFGIHPMHVESVAWISERKDLLYTLFFLPALLTYIRFIQTKEALFYGLTFVLFLLSLLSKPAAVIFPIVLFIFDLWYRRKWNMRLLTEKIPFLIAAFAMGIYTMQIQGDLEAISSIERYSILHRILFASYGFVFYIFKFFIPYPSMPFYAYPNTDNPLSWVYWVAPFVASGILFNIYWIWRRNKVMVFGILFYLLNLLLVLQFISVGGAVVSERYTYVPYIGLGLILAYWCRKWMAQYPVYEKMIQVGLAIWLLLLGAYTFQYSQVWKNGETLWSYQITQYPESGKGLINLGVYHLENYKKNRQDRPSLDKAFQYLNEALKHYPYDANALNERAGAYFEIQDVERGFKDINLLIKVEPSFYRAYLNRAILYSITNKHESAVPDYTRYLKSKPEDHQAYNWRGISYLQLKDWNKALADFNQAIQLNSQIGEYYFQRAQAHYNLGNEAQAQRDTQKAQQLGFVIPK